MWRVKWGICRSNNSTGMSLLFQETYWFCKAETRFLEFIFEKVHVICPAKVFANHVSQTLYQQLFLKFAIFVLSIGRLYLSYGLGNIAYLRLSVLIKVWLKASGYFLQIRYCLFQSSFWCFCRNSVPEGNFFLILDALWGSLKC